MLYLSEEKLYCVFSSDRVLQTPFQGWVMAIVSC